MRVIDLHCYPGTQTWIDSQGPYPEALATYWKRDWVAKTEDEVIAEFTGAGVVAELAAVEVERRVIDQSDAGQKFGRIERELCCELVDDIVDGDRIEPEPHRRAAGANNQQQQQSAQSLGSKSHVGAFLFRFLTQTSNAGSFLATSSFFSRTYCGNPSRYGG